MNLSKSKIAFFFIFVLLLIWFLYPREMFLAFIYEGQEELARSEQYYLSHLEEKPYSRFAVTRLADLYQRKGEPEKAIPLLQRLYQYRNGDWDIAQILLSHIEEMQDEEVLYQNRLEIAEKFENHPHVAKHQIIFLLEDALQYVLWQQRLDEAFSILKKLVVLAKNKQPYLEEIAHLNRSLKRTDEVVAFIKNELQRDPVNQDLRQELASVYVANQEWQKAEDILKEHIDLNKAEVSYIEFVARVQEAKGDIDKAMITIDQSLLRDDLRHFERRWLRATQARLLAQAGKIHLAISIYKDLAHKTPAIKEYWQDAISLLLESKNSAAAIELMKEYLEHFPNDLEFEQLLAQTYLYDQQDINQLKRYREYWKTSANLDFALDVLYLLEAKNHPAFESWLVELYNTAPHDARIAERYGYYLVDQKKWKEAAPIFARLQKQNPSNRAYLDQLLSLYVALEQKEKAIALLEFWEQRHEQNEQELLFVGRELFFLGQQQAALQPLQKSLALNPNLLEAWFWTGEVYHSQENHKEAERAYKQNIRLSKKKKILSANEKRFALKSAGRLKLGKSQRKAYQNHINSHPLEYDVALDYIDLLLEARDTEDARDQIAKLEKRTENNKDVDLLPYNARLAYLERRFKTAVKLYDKLVSAHPDIYYYQQERAFAYLYAGYWKNARQELERIFPDSPHQTYLAEIIQQLSIEHDHTIEVNHRYLDIGDSRQFESELHYHQYISQKVRVDIRSKQGIHHSPNGADDFSSKQEIALTHNPSTNLSVKAGALIGNSDQTSRFGALAQVKHQPSERFRWELTGHWQELRTDFPQAVNAGTKQDQVEFVSEWQPQERLALRLPYRFTYSKLPSGNSAKTHQTDPHLTYLVFKNPQFYLGYLFSFQDTEADAAFLTAVPLIQRINAHKLTASLYKRLNPKWQANASAFIGEDFARDLHFYNLGLFGSEAGLTWETNSWLRVRANYSYGRESSSGLSGQSHEIILNLSGHWR
ncbi:MAG: tetratricopeptide repeat protein [Deltaproteobacteria bacterium]|nr:tetratricopeptide repeat protein [Deltaproteobacteria bacterium]